MVSQSDYLLWILLAFVVIPFGGLGLIQVTAKMLREQRQAREAEREAERRTHIGYR